MPIHIAAAGVLNLFSWLMKISAENLADILGISKRTLLHWERCGRFASKTDKSGRKYFNSDDLMDIPEVSEMVNSHWDTELKTKPKSAYTSIELFAGAGGLALGMEQAGFKHIMLNEHDKYACATLAMLGIGADLWMSGKRYFLSLREPYGMRNQKLYCVRTCVARFRMMAGKHSASLGKP